MRFFEARIPARELPQHHANASLYYSTSYYKQEGVSIVQTHRRHLRRYVRVHVGTTIYNCQSRLNVF